MKELGIKLAIDDFGTGYSSLAYLKRLPFDVLKIDRSFVSGIGQSEEDTAIVQAVIAMAKSLRLTVTAEGIETAEQASVLKSWDCQLGQGYFFARPLTPTGLAALLSKAHIVDAAIAAARDTTLSRTEAPGTGTLSVSRSKPSESTQRARRQSSVGL